MKRLIALLFVFATFAPLQADILEQVLVKVNGDILTKTEFEQRQIGAIRARPELAGATTSNAQLERAVAELTPELILDAVDELLLVQRGREQNYTLGDEQFKGIVDNIKKQNNMEDEAKFQAALQSEGLTMADLRRNLERSMLVQQVLRTEVLDKIGVTDEEARAYYEANRREFTTPSEMTLREILIEVPASDKGVNVAQDEEARGRADDIRTRLLAGEPFPRLAGEYSASASKANGGLIGPISSEEINPQLGAVLDKLKVGDITEVMRTQRGYQILKLESRSETQIKTFEEARGDIADKVAERKLQAERLKYLDRLREQASIVWRNTELKQAYEQALAKRRGSPGI